jgi:hypothetical protein
MRLMRVKRSSRIKQYLNNYAEVFLAHGMKVGEVCRQLGVPEQSYYCGRWQYVQLQFEEWYKNWGRSGYGSGERSHWA